MVYCLQAHLIFATATTRNNRLAIAQNAIESKPRWGESVAEASEDPDPNGADIDSRFEARQDQETIEQQVLGMQGLRAGSWVQVHDCPHDESTPEPCEVERRTVI